MDMIVTLVIVFLVAVAVATYPPLRHAVLAAWHWVKGWVGGFFTSRE